uniref:AlNc14C76G5098 protein n=1 Tax=Albugo laibachii Nc14 TaxID=890382 RepID=F0WEP8_9STRA|nr:AlNc14C76G5098 [Albugo laibachii Nc14]|eukprot:CCA19680.1 AlNc14C76G5098 [Albugo laibachii Nc14]
MRSRLVLIKNIVNGLSVKLRQKDADTCIGNTLRPYPDSKKRLHLSTSVLSALYHRNINVKQFRQSFSVQAMKSSAMEDTNMCTLAELI